MSNLGRRSEKPGPGQSLQVPSTAPAPEPPMQVFGACRETGSNGKAPGCDRAIHLAVPENGGR